VVKKLEENKYNSTIVCQKPDTRGMPYIILFNSEFYGFLYRRSFS